jgi:hypothetical protein
MIWPRWPAEIIGLAGVVRVPVLLAGLLSGCAMLGPHKPAVVNAPPPQPAAAVLQQAEENAYKEGLLQGRRLQWRRDHALAATNAKPGAVEDAGTAGQAGQADQAGQAGQVTQAAPAPPVGTTVPAAPVTPVAPAPMPPLPPSAGQSGYAPSGPAMPVGVAPDPF